MCGPIVKPSKENIYIVHEVRTPYAVPIGLLITKLLNPCMKRLSRIVDVIPARLLDFGFSLNKIAILFLCTRISCGSKV